MPADGQGLIHLLRRLTPSGRLRCAAASASLRSFRTKGSNQILLRRQTKKGARGYARGLVPADGQGLIHLLRRLTPTGRLRFAAASASLRSFRTKGSNHVLLHRQTKKGAHSSTLFCLAERQGFEPWEGYKPSMVFKTTAFGRSATSPEGALGYITILENASVIPI